MSKYFDQAMEVVKSTNGKPAPEDYLKINALLTANNEADQAEEQERHDIINGIATDRLRELLGAERDGRVKVLPCKVADLLFVIYTPKHPADKSDKGKWFMAHAQVNRLKIGAKGISMETWMGSFHESEIGKTVFLKQSEAEHALAIIDAQNRG